jgi:hypothetical protein
MSNGRFKRMVVGLPQGMGTPSAVQAAADLAEFLQLELLAAFIADAALLDLAEFPAMRELRLLDQQWQPLDVARIARDLEETANLARRRFDEIVGSRTIKTGFDVFARAELMVSRIEAGDIVTIIEPSHPGESITRQFTALFDAAFETAAAILVIPRRIVRTSGPIMALAGGPEDPSIRIALEIAAALKERLIVVAPPGVPLPPDIAADAQQLAVPVEQLAGNANAPSPLPSSSRSGERLRVITRRLLGDASQLFSMLQGVPLLVLDSEQATPTRDGLSVSSA